jgi:hypothetical protein
VPSLFHTAPNRMVGTVLYPLNELEDVDPETWRQERKKYAGREQVLEKRVLPLNCLWNDVLHLSAVHPADIIAALDDVGPSHSDGDSSRSIPSISTRTALWSSSIVA